MQLHTLSLEEWRFIQNIRALSVEERAALMRAAAKLASQDSDKPPPAFHLLQIVPKI